MARNDSPLPEAKVKELLIPHELVRDPVHGDITITALERALVDTAAFQRLRGISQLGPTQLVFPGAVHNRFMHSLGTLHCADMLVGFANHNYSMHKSVRGSAVMPVEPYPRLLIRLCALLHDLAHTPFGHTLEDEGNLLPRQWKDPVRVKHWLGEESEVMTRVRGFLDHLGIDRAAILKFVDEVRVYVSHHGNPMELQHPFVVDFVGNTLCADLLDYLDRDMFFCGLRERSGDRVNRYVAVMRLAMPNPDDDDKQGEYPVASGSAAGKGRVVLLAYRIEQEHGPGGGYKPVRKEEIFSEAIDLLRRRLALAQKVYFHRTKLAASAMLISAVGSSAITWADVYDLSDTELLKKLGSDPSDRTKRLTGALTSRRLYKPLFRVDYLEEEEENELSTLLWQSIYPRLRCPEQRREAEERIEMLAALPPGSVALYCPEATMNLKEFDMLVHPQSDGQVRPLKLTLDHPRRREMGAVNDRYRHLWRLLVFVDPEVLDVSRLSSDDVRDLNAVCEVVVGVPNSVVSLQGRGRRVEDQVVCRVISAWEDENDDKVPYGTSQELISAVRRGGSDVSRIDPHTACRQHLEAIMRSAQGQQLDLPDPNDRGSK